ncbi:hypothetical protein BCR34DRAFT_599856 [Clohesyomyces aquaticus]|uniref:Uncharacterized protein n=1 Tax=Clohesyomyces aquaticus TaxID=1231657 RepID=A0A1Y1ZTX0_9PLEO|nr:hypothetical protein BCR34DRAFT_599856 [Clohesyomyces aquaticus]
MAHSGADKATSRRRSHHERTENADYTPSTSSANHHSTNTSQPQSQATTYAYTTYTCTYNTTPQTTANSTTSQNTSATRSPPQSQSQYNTTNGRPHTSTSTPTPPSSSSPFPSQSQHQHWTPVPRPWSTLNPEIPQVMENPALNRSPIPSRQQEHGQDYTRVSMATLNQLGEATDTMALWRSEEQRRGAWGSTGSVRRG